MKRIVFFCIIVPLCAGCANEDNLKGRDDKGEAPIVKAAIENAATRTVLDEEGHVLWRESDEISVFLGNDTNVEYTLESGAGTTTGLFTSPDPVSVGSEMAYNVAIYPYSAATTYAIVDGKARVTIDIPATQTYVAGSFGDGANPMMAVSTLQQKPIFSFKNVFGAVRFNLTGGAKITKVEFTGNNDEVLTGLATITMVNGEAPSLTFSGSGKKVTLDCGAGITLSSESTSFTMSLPPQVFSAGFTARFYDDEGKYMEKSTTKAFSVNRNRIVPIKAFPYEVTGEVLPSVNIEEETNPNLTIHEGYVSQKSETIGVLRNGERVAVIQLSAPIQIAQADQPEDWGFFQFPQCFYDEEGNLCVFWQMNPDNIHSYGIGAYGQVVTKDGGKSWQTSNYDLGIKVGGKKLSNGDYIDNFNPKSRDISKYSLPSPVNEEPISGSNFYHIEELPEELQGAYIAVLKAGTEKEDTLHAAVFNPGLLRYSTQGVMPLVFNGPIREEADGSLIASIYPSFFLNDDGDVLRSGVSIYRSSDEGHSWSVLKNILYSPDGNSDPTVFDGEEGYSETDLWILDNGTYVCILRTSSGTPMHIAFSTDKGATWTSPRPFTPNGVRPKFEQLGNGVLALVSGRPGVQLRFNLDGTAETWTEPIEMLPFIRQYGTYSLWDETCGYANILPIGRDSFYMVWSDFKTMNPEGEYRKAIMLRKVRIIKE